MEDEDTDWERAHLIRWEWCGGSHRLREGALESESGVGEEDADWERAHLRVEGNIVEYEDTDWERAHMIEREAWGRETPTGRERT